MQLHCKNCGARIPARNINVQTMTAVCESCDAVFTFQPAELSTGIKTKPIKVEQPPGYTVTETDTGIRLKIRWLRVLGSMEAIGMGMFVFGAVGFLFSGTAAYASVSPLLGAALLAISLLFWYLIAMFPLNHSTFEVDAAQLRIRHRPLWYPGLTLDRDEIQAFRLKPVEGFSSYQELRVVLEDGSEKRIDHFPTAHAVYIKRLLEKHLGLSESRQPIALEPAAVERLRIGDDGELLLADAPDEDTSDIGAAWDRRAASSGEHHV
jgi:hypothetical protein